MVHVAKAFGKCGRYLVFGALREGLIVVLSG